MFHISWSVDEAEWAKLVTAVSEHGAGSDFDRSCTAHYRLLYGSVAFRGDDGSLFEQAGSDDTISASLLDIGFQLAHLRRSLEIAGQGQISTADDGLEARLSVQGRTVAITTNYYDSHLAVPIDDFEAACDRLLVDLAQALRARVPSIIDWYSVAPIIASADQDGKGHGEIR